MKKRVMFGLAALLAAAGSANATLGPGDIMFVAANADDAEGFAFVALAPITSGTSISFTDSSYGNNVVGEEDKFRWTEHFSGSPLGPLVWTADTDLAVGTVVKFIENGTNTGAFSTGTYTGLPSDFSTSGDQIFAYTGTVTDGGGASAYRGDTSGITFIGGFNWANAGWITSGAGSTSNSYLPASLAGGLAPTGPDFDNLVYSGPTSFNSVAELRAALADFGNWTGDNATAYGTQSFPMQFTIPTPGAAALLGLGGLMALRRRR